MTDTTSKFDQWAVLEIMGHQRYAGRVTEQSIGGQSFVRIDVPEIDEGRPAFTKLFGSGSIYCISPVTETVARLMCRQLRQKAISIFDLPKSFRDQLEHKPEAGNHDHEGCDDEEHF